MVRQGAAFVRPLETRVASETMAALAEKAKPLGELPFVVEQVA